MSQAQTTQTRDQQAAHDEPFFAKSQSAAQNISGMDQGFWQQRDTNQEDAPKEEGPVFRKSQHESHGIVWRLKNAAKKENLMGTVMTLGFIKGWADKTLGAWGISAPTSKFKLPLPSIPGSGTVNQALYGKGFDKSKLSFNGEGQKPQTKMEKMMAAGVTAALAQNVAFFMTARGGEVPEGDTILQKTVNSLKHPDKHSVHFCTVTISAILALLSAGRTGVALQGFKDMRGNQYAGKGDFLRSNDFQKNASMLVGGLSGLICSPLIFAGLFGIKDKPADKQAEKDGSDAADKPLKSFAESKAEKGKGGFMASVRPGHLKDMWNYAVKHDRVGLIGRGLALVLELGFIAEGRLALAKDPTNAAAYKTVQGGLVGLVLSVMQSHFVYDKLLNNSREAAPSR